ncbi:MAG: pyridoxamine 5'-phosphate oxidase family protein [Candidatus Atabeyarchaeum deiterrae]
MHHEDEAASVAAQFSFDYVERSLRSKNFGILSTVTPQRRAHSVGVVYGVTPPKLPFSLYLITRPNLRKARNIQMNPNVSFVVPVPHYFLRFVPPSCVQFQGTAEMLPADDRIAIEIFNSSRVLRHSLEHTKTLGKPVFIRITPDERIFCWGIGASVWQIIRHLAGNLYVVVPEHRRKIKEGSDQLNMAKAKEASGCCDLQT